MELGLKIHGHCQSGQCGCEKGTWRHVIDKIYGILLGIPSINLQGPDSSGIIHGRILKAADRLGMRSLELQKLYIDLDMMSGHLLFIALGLYRSFLSISGEPIQAISLENLVDYTRGDLQAMVPLQEPRDPELAQVVGLSQIEDLFFDLLWDPKSGIFRARFGVN